MTARADTGHNSLPPMTHLVQRLASSIWLLAASLLPGPGWALCVSANGHVALEATAVTAPLHATAPAEGTCESECPPEECGSCHDVSLSDPDRVCPRRDAGAMDHDFVPRCIEHLSAPEAGARIVHPQAAADGPRRVETRSPVLRC